MGGWSTSSSSLHGRSNDSSWIGCRCVSHSNIWITIETGRRTSERRWSRRKRLSTMMYNYSRRIIIVILEFSDPVQDWYSLLTCCYYCCCCVRRRKGRAQRLLRVPTQKWACPVREEWSERSEWSEREMTTTEIHSFPNSNWSIAYTKYHLRIVNQWNLEPTGDWSVAKKEEHLTSWHPPSALGIPGGRRSQPSTKLEKCFWGEKKTSSYASEPRRPFWKSFI